MSEKQNQGLNADDKAADENPRTAVTTQQKQSGKLSKTENRPAGLQRAKDNPDRLEPTRYGDWEKAGRCIDF